MILGNPDVTVYRQHHMAKKKTNQEFEPRQMITVAKI